MSDRSVRIFSSYGPCLTRVDGAGKVIGETSSFWLTQQDGGKVSRVKKARRGVHVEPCKSCPDHPATHYPHGYMD